MTRILRRTLSSGPIGSVRRGIRLLCRKHARLLAIAVLVSLLVSSLPVASSNSQGVNRPTTAPAQQQSRSFAVQLYSTVSKTVTSIGSWMASFIEPEPTSTYQPVAAYITPAPPFIDAPTNLTVTAASSTGINLSWTAPSGTVDHYVVERSQNIQGPFFFLANVTGATTKNDTTVTNLNAYLYRVRAISNTGAVSSPSNMACGTAISFQFSSLAGQEISAQHFHDVRTAINAVRPLGNLAAENWDRSNLVGFEVKADDVNEMRTALDAALTALSIPVTAYEDPTLSVGATGTLIKAIHIEQLQTRSTKGSSTSSGPIDSDSSTARLDPLNETGGGGENPLSRNFNWNLPVVSLPGRAGLNLGLMLSYNSLVWTKIGSNAISFDEDNGFPGPGFRLGFPVIQQRYFNSEVGKQAYLLISPDGSRTELRQVGTSTFYEAADSSHLLLDEFTMILRTTDGTQLSYAAHGGEFKCTQIKDRNGNFISVSYTPEGRINTVTDTLNRVITFNYINGWLDKITQVWNQGLPSQVTHNWARFEYADKTIDTNFPGLTVFGPAYNTNIKTLTKVTLADDSRFEFSYTSWGQVWKVTRFAADNSVLNYRTYDLPQTGTLAHADCPRFTVRKDWAKYWNGDTDGTTSASEEVATATFIVPVSDSWTMPDNTAATGVRTQVTTPDGTLNKIYFVGTTGTDSGWKRGLAALVETHSGSQSNRKVMTTWTQDDETSLFVLNPRVKETNVYDPDGNRARTEVDYGDPSDLGNGMSCRLPRVVIEYAANATTKLRSTRTTYNMTAPYKDRRILGLVSVKELFEGDVNGALKSKVSFFYDNDNGSTSIQGTDAPVQHDNTDYTASFVTGRANLSSVQRFNVDNLAESTTTRTKYNTAGAVVSAKDALNHEVTISYADSFSDGTSRNTLAYATKVTDPDTFETTTKYNFDFGAVTSQRSPKPNETTNVAESQRPEQVFTYDSLGRLEEITNSVNSALTRFEYPNTNRVDTFATIQEGKGEAHSFRITDGAGRVVATAADHPGSVNGFSGQKIVYDVMGRVFKTSNPTETSAGGAPSQWVAAGDDASAGWLYTEQTYDWKGRPLRTTHPDGTYKEASYSNCGCAGGEVITFTDEGTLVNGSTKKRQQKVYTDVLGRIWKTESLNWDGTGSHGTGPNNTVYSTRVTTLNVRDQVMQVREHLGAETSGTFLEMTMNYDGYGRLQSQHAPEQNAATNTVWTYNADDTINTITDARGAVSTFGYAGTNRHLVKSISHTLSGSTTMNSTFEYDAVGNRTLMTDSTGNTNYEYDSLSRLTSETRQFSGPGAPTGDFTLAYEYTLSGAVKKVTDERALTSFSTDYDKVGRILEVTGVGFNGANTTFISSTQYRAWGAPKIIAHGNGITVTAGYDSRLRMATKAVSGFKMSWIIDPPLPPFSVEENFEYYADGRLKFATRHHPSQILGDLRTHDRAYEYDHVGRVKEAYSGLEAHDFVGDLNSGTPEGPYRLSFTYDAWENILTGGGRYWSRGNESSATFNSQNRNPAWEYDSDGRLISRNEPPDFPGVQPYQQTYDATGQPSVATQTFHFFEPLIQQSVLTALTNTQKYDGDGSLVEYRKERLDSVNLGANGVNVNFHLRSTVLGGLGISEYDGSGVWQRSHVYAGTDVLGEQSKNGSQARSTFRHLNPLIGDEWNSRANGDFGGESVIDPLGVNVAGSDPFPADGTGDPDGFVGPNALVPADRGEGLMLATAESGTTCVLDGMRVDCSWIGNSAVQCPDNDCGPRRVRYQGQNVWAHFQAFGDGYSGFVPTTARYVGNGGIAPRGTGGPPRRTGRGPDRRNDTDLGRLNGGRHPEEDLGYNDSRSMWFLTPASLEPQNTTQQQQQPCDPHFFGENDSFNIGGRAFTGGDLNVAARVVYAESSSGFSGVNNGPVGSQVFDERNAIASVLYNLLSPTLSTFNAVAHGGRFQAVSSAQHNRKFLGSSISTGAYRNLSERTADGRGGDCNDLRSSVDAIRRMVNNNGPYYGFNRFRGGRTPVGNSTVIGGSRFGYGGITNTGLGPW